MSKTDIGIAVISLIFVLIVSISSKTKPNNKTDGVFESALYKLDNHQNLTADEQQRLDDIINWCNDCNKPLRMCRH